VITILMPIAATANALELTESPQRLPLRRRVCGNGSRCLESRVPDLTQLPPLQIAIMV
jgi:hypothetical protein